MERSAQISGGPTPERILRGQGEERNGKRGPAPLLLFGYLQSLDISPQPQHESHHASIGIALSCPRGRPGKEGQKNPRAI